MQRFKGGYVLGGDVSSSGAKLLAMDESGNVLAVGRAKYDYVSGLPKGACRLDQAVMMAGLREARNDLARRIDLDPNTCRGISLGGAMHGLNVLDAAGNPLDTIVCWDDEGDEAEALELTRELDVPIPRRFTVARYRGWRKRNPERAALAARVLTPSGYATYRGCGAFAVLPGDASGMAGYMREAQSFNLGAVEAAEPQLARMLPRVHSFGEKIGETNAEGAEIFQVAVGTPWAAPCGDQPLGSYGKGCSRPGDISIELGSSVVANVFGRGVFFEKRGLVDALRSSLGDDMGMCCVTNGAQAYQRLVKFLSALFAGTEAELYAKLDQLASATEPGAGGLMALPFFKGEGSLLQEKSFGAILGMTDASFTPGNLARAFMETPVLILRNALEEMGVLRLPSNVVVSGGGANSTLWPQIVADILSAPVRVSACTEAVAFGAALNALAAAKGLAGESISAEALADECCKFGPTYTPRRECRDFYSRLAEKILHAERVLRPAFALWG